MPREQRQAGADLPGFEAPEPLTLADHIPPASIVGDFVMELPGLAASLPGTLSETVMGISDHITGRDREAGG